MNVYEYGSSPTLTATITNASGVNTDPATLTFKVKNPAGDVTTYVYGTDVELVKSATGVYYVELYCTSGGIWCWQFAATNPACRLEGRFNIKMSVM